MKTKLLLLTSFIALILAGVCAWQQRQLRVASARLEQTQQQLRAESEARADQENRSKALERSQAGLSQQVMEFSSLVGKLRSSPGTSGGNDVQTTRASTNQLTDAADDSADGGLFGGKAMRGMLEKMMKDPAMKEMMRSQQKTMVTKMYGPLFKDLALNAERKDKLTELLLDQQMKAVENAGGLFDKDGKLNAGKIAETAKQDEQQTDAGIKALLGDQFAYYEDYKKYMSERMQLEELKQQLDGTKTALKDTQLKDLLFVMSDERDKNPPIISKDPGASPEKIQEMFSGDTMEKQMEWQEQINRRVLERAGQILDAEQLKAYADFQAQQLNMQKFGIKMMREMWGKKGASNQSPVPTVEK